MNIDEDLYGKVSDFYFKYGLIVADSELEFLIDIGPKLRDFQSLTDEELRRLEILLNKYKTNIHNKGHKIGELVC
jgi:hypothetical protein